MTTSTTTLPQRCLWSSYESLPNHAGIERGRVGEWMHIDLECQCVTQAWPQGSTPPATKHSCLIARERTALFLTSSCSHSPHTHTPSHAKRAHLIFSLIHACSLHHQTHHHTATGSSRHSGKTVANRKKRVHGANQRGDRAPQPLSTNKATSTSTHLPTHWPLRK